MPGKISGPSLMAKAAIGDDSIETKSVDLGHHDAAQPVPTARYVRRRLQSGAEVGLIGRRAVKARMRSASIIEVEILTDRCARYADLMPLVTPPETNLVPPSWEAAVRARSTRLAGSVRDCAIDLNLSTSVISVPIPG